MSHLMHPNSLHLGRRLLGEAVSCLETAGGARCSPPEGQLFIARTQLPSSLSSVRGGEPGGYSTDIGSMLKAGSWTTSPRDAVRCPLQLPGTPAASVPLRIL